MLEQLKQLGCSCDWDRTKFTMDPDMSASVIRSFVDLYNKGYIYRGYRMVNWDPEAKTTLSDEEVIHEERQGKLYYINYKVEGSNDVLTIATTRPETIFGDTAICINPNDERFTHLKSKKAIVPICNRVIPIIEDEYVDIESGEVMKFQSKDFPKMLESDELKDQIYRRICEAQILQYKSNKSNKR